MPRIKLQEQPGYEFKYEISLIPRDINYGNHLGNDALISLVNAAMVNLFRCLGITDSYLGDGKTGKIMADLAVNYKSEGYLFDVLQIDSHIGEIGRKNFRIFYRVTREGELLALAETGFLAFDYARRQSVPIPWEFLQILAEWVKKNYNDSG